MSAMTDDNLPPSLDDINLWISEIKLSNKANPVSNKVSGWLLSHEEILLLVQKAADYELDSVCAYLHSEMARTHAKRLEDELRAALRPKTPTLDELALQFLGTIEKDGRYLPEITDTIRKALTAKCNSPEL